MAEKLINSKVQQRNDTAASWTLANPILLRGEIGIEYDTGKIKIGDGSSKWTALPYIGVGITQADVLNFTYPIGSIKMTVTAENPGEKIGGVWERWGNGRVPIAVDENDTDLASAELTGGEKEHTLTEEEIPSHSHDAELPISGESELGGKNGISEMAIGGTVTVSTEAVGGGKAHNNLPPFITCYFWKRTA